MSISTLTLLEPGGARKIPFLPPQLLSTLLNESHADVEMPCGGRQTCRKCKVIAQGDLSPPSMHEKSMLATEPEGTRFACMTQALGDVTLRPLRKLGQGTVQLAGTLPAFPLMPWTSGYGMALDLGTTTLAAYLYGLEDGELLAQASALNPQAAFGADVITRIQKALEGQSHALAQSIRQSIRDLAQALCTQAGITLADLSALVLTGNTAMLYLLCQEDPTPLAAMPFHPERLFGEFLSPDVLGLPDTLRIYLPRCIAAYVGADISTALIAAQFHSEAGPYQGPPILLADIGTNGEIALAAHGRLLCCATAAGPAFEGAGISCGMMAKPGAIDSVDYMDGEIRHTVLGGGEALGICGSGLLDAVAALLEAGLLDETGLLDTPDQRCTLPGTQITLTQQDIRAVQLAKAAIHAGMIALLAEAKLQPEDLSELLIAGGFGSHLRIASAERIGLIPSGLAAKTRTLGNAAGMGASMLLLSQPLLAASQEIQAQVLELSTDPRFMDAYIESMLFE